jgi:hypothetical protein
MKKLEKREKILNQNSLFRNVIFDIRETKCHEMRGQNITMKRASQTFNRRKVEIKVRNL